MYLHDLLIYHYLIFLQYQIYFDAFGIFLFEVYAF